jgi:hypothetical protein
MKEQPSNENESRKQKPVAKSRKEPVIRRKPSSQPSRNPADSTDVPMSGRIAQRAYEIYLERTSRGPLDDWLEAEREIVRHEASE